MGKGKNRTVSTICISAPEELKGKWESVFEQYQPLHIEIGTGKGRFITEMAKANPTINYLGLELQQSVIVICS